MSHLQNCSLKIYLKRALGGGGGGGGRVGLGGQDGCKRRIKVFVKLKKIFIYLLFFFFFFWGGGGGGQGRCEQRSEVFVKIKKINCGGGGSVWGGGG